MVLLIHSGQISYEVKKTGACAPVFLLYTALFCHP